MTEQCTVIFQTSTTVVDVSNLHRLFRLENQKGYLPSPEVALIHSSLQTTANRIVFLIAALALISICVPL